MKIKISRTFEIRANKTKTLKALRAAGYSISANKWLIHNGSFIGDKAELIAELCKTGSLVCTRKSVEEISQDSYFRGRLSLMVAKVKNTRLDYARGVAEAFHRNVRPLYVSKRAGVTVQTGFFNENALEETDWGAYSKSYGHPAVYKNAAVVVRGKEFDVYTSRGTKVATFPIPHWKQIPKYYFGLQLVGGEIYAIEVHRDVYARYNTKGNITGYAALLIHPATQKPYYEHGETISDIKAEYRHKVQIEKQLAFDRKHTATIKRAKRLIMRMVGRAIVSYQDARNVGYCTAGIQGFCSKTGIAFSEQTTVPYSFLKRYPETLRLREAVAEKLAKSIIF